MSKKDGLVGWDFAEKARKVGEALEAEFRDDATRNRIEAEQNKAAYERNHTYRVATKRVGTMWEARTLEHPPLCGQLVALGRTEIHAICELRIVWARTLYAKKLLHNWDDCRAYATKATFIRDVIV